jgi:hypothetical protein
VGDDKDLKVQIERLYDICPNIYYMDFLIDGKLSVISQFLLRHGHKARPYFTQIIDLTKTPKQLHKEMRKSYKSIVNGDNNDYWVTSDRLPSALMEMRKIHDACSDPRPIKTWEIQEKMWHKNEAQFFLGNDSYVIIHHNKYCAYYFSGRSLNKNTHGLIVQAISQAWVDLRPSESYTRIIEMGEQVFSGDPKLINISKFKRGFGGVCKTRLILEKE